MNIDQETLEFIVAKTIAKAKQPIFRKADPRGNGDHKLDWKKILGTVVATVAGFIIIGLVSAAVNRVTNTSILERKIDAALEYMEISAILNDTQSDRINLQTQELAKHLNWHPCPDPLPHVADFKKDRREINGGNQGNQ